MNTHHIVGIPGPFVSTISESHSNPCIISILIYFPRGLETGSIFQNYIWTQIEAKDCAQSGHTPFKTFSPLIKHSLPPTTTINKSASDYWELSFPNCFLYMGLVQQETFTCLYEGSSSWLKDDANKYNLFDLYIIYTLNLSFQPTIWIKCQ